MVEQNVELPETVDSLINMETRWWDTQKIRAIFNPILVEKILKIVICPMGYEDRWMWMEERSGVFVFEVPINCCKRIVTMLKGRVLIAVFLTSFGKQFGS